MRYDHFKRVESFTGYFPDGLDLKEGILYVSFFRGNRRGPAKHICPCGCGNVVVTPINMPSAWSYSEGEDGLPTLNPSILNPCGAHYFIRDGRIVTA